MSSRPTEPDNLPMLEAELAAAHKRIAEHRAEINRRWDAIHASNAEIRDLENAIARLGGGLDADYYHRRRERAVGRIVRIGIHTVTEDGA